MMGRKWSSLASKRWSNAAESGRDKVRDKLSLLAESRIARNLLARRRSRKWAGFAAGAVAGAVAAAGAVVLWRFAGRMREGRILRIDKSLQIGRPVEEVFQAWSDLARLPQYVDFIREVRCDGPLSDWTVDLDGRMVHWRAETTQHVPNQALGWKSLRGPHHTGRIDFSPIGHDTLVHITMNYEPPLRLGRLFSPAAPMLEGRIERALREFKSALENGGRAAQRATGTEGQLAAPGEQPPSRHADIRQTSRFGSPDLAVDYTRPPETKS
ncbi:MAG TPA: SRPBCC family protein [Terriglobales bacterium]|nr:SRPBCC family protein [Terriglobales bacterium]